MSTESVKLFYKDGSSDKVYLAELAEKDGGWVVNFQYGKRGSTLKAGTKTSTPIDYAAAKKEYDKLVAEKVGKGYKPDVGPESVSLYYKDGGSDKVYLAEITQKDDGWVVNFQYGKRGSSLKAGTKTTSAVEYEVAKKEYDKLVAEKVGKGYQLESSSGGLAIQDINSDKVHSGLTPQLLNPVEAAKGKDLISDNSYIAQEKYDGERRMVRKNADSTVEGTNRKGFVVPMPLSIEKLVKELDCTSITLDGEDMGDHGLVLFDILELNGKDLSGESVETRLKTLYQVVSGNKPEIVDGFYPGVSKDKLYVTATATTRQAKEKLLEQLKTDCKEGIVFKDKNSRYVPGRPASGGSQLKWKFVESATCMVGMQNQTKRSVSLLMLDKGGVWTDVGNVTIPVNFDIPQAQAIVEINYLYANRGGSLYQPVFKGERHDQGPEDCVMSQLKYKGDVNLENGLNI